MVFVILLEVHKVIFLNRYQVLMLLLVKSKFAHLQQYDENHCVYLARIGRDSEKSQQKRDHACATQNYLDLLNLCK